MRPLQVLRFYRAIIFGMICLVLYQENLNAKLLNSCTVSDTLYSKTCSSTAEREIQGFYLTDGVSSFLDPTSDTAKFDSVVDKRPIVSKIIIQSLIGEVVFGGVFFGLKGNELLNGQSAKITPAYDPSIALLAWAASAIAITVWGNAFSYGENNCWRPILGGVAGLFFGPLIDRLSGGRLSATELGSYLVLSQFSIAGAIATYYLWPTEPDSSSNGSSSKVHIAPFFSPYSSGVGFSYIIP